MTMDTAQLVLAYRNIRDARAAATKAYEAKDAEHAENLRKIGAVLLKHLNDTKQEGGSTTEGTFYKKKKITPSALDWDTVYAWIAENNAWELLQKRLGVEFVKK